MAEAGGEGRRYRLLGALQVLDGDRQLEVGTAKQRALLTILLLRANHVVPTDVLIDKLWSGEPPASATTTLHGYVSGLRRVLGADVIRTASPGYVIDLAPGALDVEAFETLCASGRTALGSEDWSTASAALRAALDLWRGPALADVATESFAVADAVRLDQSRLAAIDGWARAELALGHHAEVAGDLEAALAESPLREDLRARLVLALYRCGRQADALRSLAAGRALLVDEVGIDPGPELVALEGAILAQDPALAWSPPTPQRRPDEHVAPRVRPASAGMVGRDDELAIVLEDLSAALGGDGRIVLIGGEPGIGKTRLTEEVARIGAERGAAVAWGRSSEVRGAPAFWPWNHVIADLLERHGAAAAKEALGDSASDVAMVAPALAALVGDAPTGTTSDVESARFRAYEATTRFLVRLAARRPLLIVLDDLHWADVASLELLSFVARSVAQAPILVMATFRTIDPTFTPALTETLANLARASSRRLDLMGLDLGAVARLLGDHLDESDETVVDVYQRTHGNPFFLGELVRWMSTAKGGQDRDGVPAAVGEVIRDRVGRLPPPVATALADASILGQHLEAEMLGAVIGLEPLPLLDLLAPALSAGLLVGDGLRGRWRFSHGLVCETLATGLDVARRTDLHLRAAQALESRHGEAPGPHLAVLAQHLVDAIPATPRHHAVAVLRRAAAWAESHLAYEQADEQLRTALDIVAEMPAGQARDAIELEVQEHVGRLLMTTIGYGAPGLDVACARMRVLCANLDANHPMLVPALWRLSTFHTVRTELDVAIDLGQQLFDLGEASGDPARMLIGHMAMGTIGTHRSDFAVARAHLDAALALCRDGHDATFKDLLPETPLVWTLVFSAWNHWALGESTVAEQEVLEAVDTARTIGGGGSYATTFAIWFAGLIAALRQDAPLAVERCDAGIAAAIAGGFGMLIPFMAINRGWAVAASGDIDAGIAVMEEPSARIEAAGVRMLRHVFPGYMADAHLRAQRFDAAEAHARRGLAAADETGERWYEPELHRLLGLALAAQGDGAGAHAAVQQAIEVATVQGGRELLARAHASLAELNS